MSITQRIFLSLTALVLISACNSSSTAETLPILPRFTIEDLGALPPIAADTGLGINTSGQISLWAHSGAVSVRAALWTGQRLEQLDPPPAGYLSSLARGLNDEGAWVGWAVTGGNLVDSLATTRGFVRNGKKTRLVTTLGGRDSHAFAINSHGTIVGSADCADGHCHAFQDDGKTMTDLGTLPGGGFSQAVAVNGSGVAVGVADENTSLQRQPRRHAVLWRGGHIQDLGILPGGRASSALAVNEEGQAAGYSETLDGYHAALWADGKIEDLGTLGNEPSIARGLNDHGEVVGASYLEKRKRHAFYWQNGQMTDLNNLVPARGWVLTQADAINNRGQIACQGQYLSGPVHALLLTPEVSSFALRSQTSFRQVQTNSH